MAYLVKKLQSTYPNMQEKTRIVVGFSADKDLKLCGSALLGYVTDASRLHLVEAAHPRAAKLEDMLEAEPALRESNFDVEDRYKDPMAGSKSFADPSSLVVILRRHYEMTPMIPTDFQN